jgi:hypothetical protein
VTAHELARKLLEGPDIEVAHPYEFNNEEGHHLYDTVDIVNTLVVPVLNDAGYFVKKTAVVLL